MPDLRGASGSLCRLHAYLVGVIPRSMQARPSVGLTAKRERERERDRLDVGSTSIPTGFEETSSDGMRPQPLTEHFGFRRPVWELPARALLQETP